MNIELHILQNFAPSCLNRDDTNSPKDCEFGGHRRARISSQCIKRSIRRYFDAENLLGKDDLAERSKRLVGEMVTQLTAKGRDAAPAAERVRAALAAVRLAADETTNETQYLLFLGRREIAALADVIHRHWDSLGGAPAEEPPADDAKKGRGKSAKQKKSEAREAVPAEVAKQVKAVFNGGKAADVALFGRMLADQADLNVDAACQVAHALSTNRVSQEMDFYTAVDDLKQRSEEEDAGAGMLGTVEYNSACFYRYANIHFGQLVENLQGDLDLARRTVKAFLTAAVHAIPTGKQNTFAAHNPPSLVFAIVRRRGLQSLANAFEKPVSGRDRLGLVGGSIKQLDQYWADLTKAYGKGGLVAAAAFRLGDDPKFDVLAEYEVSGFEGLLTNIMAAVEGGAA